MKRSWYLGLTPAEIGRRCVLVGDPGRVELFAAHLRGPRTVSEQRGLHTITGDFDGVPVTVTAVGMGAPIATIVLEELASLGAEVVLRAGTAMSVGPEVPLGSFVVANAAFRGEGTSLSYAPLGYPSVADPDLTARIATELERAAESYRVGTIASFDGFFTEMLALDPDREQAVRERLALLRRLRVLATDMETSAVLVAGALLGIRAGSLCLVSVAGGTRERLEETARDAGERRLVDLAVHAVARVRDGDLAS